MTTASGLRAIGFHWQPILLLSHRGSGLEYEQVQQVQSWLIQTGVSGRPVTAEGTWPSSHH